MAKELALLPPPLVLVIGDCAYYLEDVDIHFVLARKPYGFLEFSFDVHVKWEPTDQDGLSMREFILRRFRQSTRGHLTP